MRVFSQLVFDDFVQTTGGSITAYTSNAFESLLASCDKLVLFVVVDSISGTASIALYIAIEHSADRRNWVQKSPGPDLPGAPLTPGDIGYSDVQDASPTVPTGAFVRLRIDLTATSSPSAHIKIYAVGRDTAVPRLRAASARAARASADGRDADAGTCACGGGNGGTRPQASSRRNATLQLPAAHKTPLYAAPKGSCNIADNPDCPGDPHEPCYLPGTWKTSPSDGPCDVLVKTCHQTCTGCSGGLSGCSACSNCCFNKYNACKKGYYSPSEKMPGSQGEMQLHDCDTLWGCSPRDPCETLWKGCYVSCEKYKYGGQKSQCQDCCAKASTSCNETGHWIEPEGGCDAVAPQP